jgi:hypothetical protein
MTLTVGSVWFREEPFRTRDRGASSAEGAPSGQRLPTGDGRWVVVEPATRKRACRLLDRIKRDKGVWWMPWQQEAMKDVALCDKPGGGESTL